MTLKEHKKHSLITRPNYGQFGRQEWAILGTNCGAIKTLADDVIKALAPAYTCGYVDAQHADSDDELALPARLAAGATTVYTDQINYHQFDINKSLNSFQFRSLFSDMDVVFVNGNHAQAKAQVVVIDAAKEASLKKRLSQLTNVQLILLADNMDGVFDFVQDTMPAWQDIPKYRLHETEKIVSFFQKQMQLVKPKLNGLVLAGGKSQRMGEDKGAIAWHGKEQRYYAADMLKPFCEEVYISCRPEQQAEMDNNYPGLTDTFTDLGPYGAILSAFREQPDAAWLVVACDLPLLNAATLQHLAENRNTSFTATAFQRSDKDFPEPLVAIWEPKSYPILLSFLAQGFTCPRKVLINSDVHLILSPDADALLNVNTPDEAKHAKTILQQKSAVK